MKKTILLIALLMPALLLITATPAFAVSVEVATEEVLNRYDSYHEFMEFKEEGYQKIVFLTAAPLKAFKFIEIVRNDIGLPTAGNALYSLDELRPGEPFVVTWMEWGSMPHRGITFIDGNDQTRCFFISSHGGDGSLVLTEYPVVYQGVPKAYKPILDALFLLEERLRQEEYDSDEDLETVGFAEDPYPRDSALGYALADLDGDGVLELLLGSMEGLNASAPNSVFTLRDGQPVLLKSFWSRNRGIILEDGTICSVGSGGAADTYLSSFKLDKGTGALIQLTDIHSGYSQAEEKIYFVRVVNGKEHYISEQEFDDFLTMYEKSPNRMYLRIPIALQR
ncbi:hypothetical protein LJC31_04910 [Synergistaceae bacterium OttesenSCG-928-I11]|nr:hypothetical protein [Synergistaceae bacterium OttesenSCG-928-I11]